MNMSAVATKHLSRLTLAAVTVVVRTGVCSTTSHGASSLRRSMKMWQRSACSEHSRIMCLMMLLRCHRTLDEAKLLERALISAITDDEARTLTLAVFESSLSTASTESAESTYVSQVDAVAILAALAVPAPLEIPPVLIEFQRPPSRAELVSQDSKRMSVMGGDGRKSPESLLRAEQELEAQRRLEARAQLEAFWRRTARVAKVCVCLLVVTSCCDDTVAFDRHTDAHYLSRCSCRSIQATCTWMCWRS